MISGLERAATIVGEMLLPPTPDERDPLYFRCWQRVSVTLQKSVRRWAREIYFRDIARCADRDAAYVMLVYSVSRPFFGRPRSEFTYDPADAETMKSAWQFIGTGLRNVLAEIEARLREEGEIELSHRYEPVWYQDILRAVEKRERHFLKLLAREAKVIDAVIDLGTRRDAAAESRFERAAGGALRNFGGVDMRALIPKILGQTASLLDSQTRETDLVSSAACLPVE